MIFSASSGWRLFSADQIASSDHRISSEKGLTCPCPRSVNRTAFLPSRSNGSIVQFAVHRGAPLLPETTTAPLSAGTDGGALIRSARSRMKRQIVVSIGRLFTLSYFREGEILGGHRPPLHFQKLTRALTTNVRFPAPSAFIAVMRPNPALLMFRLGLAKRGWFNTLIASTRTSNSLLSAILTRLSKFTSKPTVRGPSIHL